MALDPLHHVIDQPLLGPITKYQVLLVVAAAILAAIYVPLARRIQTGEAPRGKFWNFFESILTYFRNEVVRPNIHDPHDKNHETADRYVPFIWSVFLFILICNLLGLVPIIGGSPTADISVTIVLAVLAFLIGHVSAVAKLGVGGYLLSYVPRLKSDNLAINLFLWILVVPMITVTEVAGALIRGGVLAVRLFANMFAGHLSLAVIIGLVAVIVNAGLAWYASGPLSLLVIVGATLMSLLELFVAFLQAFVFALLAAIYIGMAMHPQH